MVQAFYQATDIVSSSRMVAIASLRLTEGKRSGLSQSDAWNSSTCDWIIASNVSVMVGVRS